MPQLDIEPNGYLWQSLTYGTYGYLWQVLITEILSSSIN